MPNGKPEFGAGSVESAGGKHEAGRCTWFGPSAGMTTGSVQAVSGRCLHRGLGFPAVGDDPRRDRLESSPCGGDDRGPLDDGAAGGMGSGQSSDQGPNRVVVHADTVVHDWPLLGIAVSGIHDVTPEQVRNAWDAMPAGQPVEFTPEQRRMFFYGPEWTIESDIVSRADASAAPIPLAELLEVVGRWPDQAAELAAKVTVPVQYLACEFERLWCIDADLVRSFAAYFTAAPLVVSELMAGIGHNADHHRNSQAFHLRQLAFALDCGKRTARPAGTAAASAERSADCKDGECSDPGLTHDRAATTAAGRATGDPGSKSTRRSPTPNGVRDARNHAPASVSMTNRETPAADDEQSRGQSDLSQRRA